MTRQQSDTANMDAWQKPEWRIGSHYVPGYTIEIAPPAPSTEFEAWEPEPFNPTGNYQLTTPTEQQDEDTEDMLEGMATKYIYETRGVKGFRPYSEYRARKLRRG